MTALEARKALQTTLGVTPDGSIGPVTMRALDQLSAAKPASPWPPLPDAPLPPGGTLEARTERNIATLHARVQPLARAFIAKTAEKGIDLRITSGTRTYAEQNALYEQGRSKPGKIVTSARGGHSSHNFGTAFDVTLFSGSAPVWESPKYAAAAVIGKSLGLSWGGDWSKPDEPHFYLKPAWAKDLNEAKMMAELRTRHDAGRDAYA